MTENSEIFKEDMEWICKKDLSWEKLRNSTVLVTGGTGLIGMIMINSLIFDTSLSVKTPLFSTVVSPLLITKNFADPPSVSFLSLA